MAQDQLIELHERGPSVEVSLNHQQHQQLKQVMSFYDSIANSFDEDQREVDTDSKLDERDNGAPLTLSYSRPDLQTKDSNIFSVRASDYVGVIAVDGITITIAPKIDLMHFLYIISRATGWDILREKESRQLDLSSQPHSFLEVVATWFLDQVARLIPKRLLSDYRRTEDFTAFVRGSVDPRRTTDAWLRGELLVYNSFDVFDVDTPQNRLLKEALRVTSLFPNLPAAVSRRARGLYSLLDDVGFYQPSDSRAPTDRRYLSMGFAPALGLARRLISNRGYRSTQSDQYTQPFLLKTFELIETGIRTILATGFRDSHAIDKSTIFYQDQKKAAPDLVFTAKRTNARVATGDVKYKFADSWDSHRVDLYQATYFATAARVRAGCTIYFSEQPLRPDISEFPGDISLRQLYWNCASNTSPRDSEEKLLLEVQEMLSTAGG